MLLLLSPPPTHTCSTELRPPPPPYSSSVHSLYYCRTTQNSIFLDRSFKHHDRGRLLPIFNGTLPSVLSREKNPLDRDVAPPSTQSSSDAHEGSPTPTHSSFDAVLLFDAGDDGVLYINWR